MKVLYKKYYIEVYDLDNQGSYILQSKWFKTRKSAIDWYKNNISFVDENIVGVALMSAVFYDKETYDIIKSEKI